MARKLISNEFDERALHMWMMRTDLKLTFKVIADYYPLSTTRVRKIIQNVEKNFGRQYYKKGKTTGNKKTITRTFRVYEEKPRLKKTAVPDKNVYREVTVHIIRDPEFYKRFAKGW